MWPVKQRSAKAPLMTASSKTTCGQASARARSGAGAAIVGNPDQVAAKLQAYQGVGIGAFILSGYTHAAECDLFAEHVLPKLAHAPIKPRFTH